MLPIATVSASIDPYVIATEGVVTNSKLKCFMACPQAYKIIYLDKTPLERKVKKYFRLGTCFDDLISYGEDKWNEKYSILDKGQSTLGEDALYDAIESVATLKYELTEREHKLETAISSGKATAQAEKSVISWTEKLQKATEKLTEIEERSKKIELTATEGDLIAKLQREAMRQPLFEYGGSYECQKEFTAIYKGKLKVGGKPDRVNLGDGGIIRDTKLIEDCEKAEFKIQDFQYVRQLAFYQLLIELNTGKRLPCVFDLFDKKEVPQYRCLTIPQELLDQAKKEIVQGLDYLLRCQEEDYYPDHQEIGLPDSQCMAYDHCSGAIKKTYEYYC
jgi:hypothetical protein